MKTQILILCALSLFLADNVLAQGNWVSADQNVSSAVATSTGQLSVSGSYTWNGTVAYSNDKHVATLTYALPPSLVALTGTPSLVYASNNSPVQGVNFTNTTRAWQCTFGSGTSFTPGTKLIFGISNMEIQDDKAYTNQMASHFISFLSSPANELMLDNSATAIFQTTINGPLPVAIVDFSVTKQENSDLVKWTTLSESNSSHFNVQRSLDGNNFETLETVKSKAVGGVSTSSLNYSYVDDAPQLGHNYYRLEQVDLDTKVNYTKTIDIIWGAAGSVVTIYPNPTSDFINVDISTSKITQTEIKLLDLSGRVVKSVIAQTKKGVNNIRLDMTEVAIGVYGIQIFENNNLTLSSKVRKN